jgi:cellulose biosynthesis protein BcsQ
LLKAAQKREAQVVLIDVGPNLGAINRAAIIAARHVVIPLAPDLFSLQGLRNLGPTLRRWRGDCAERLKKNPDPELILPEAEMRPAGYVLMQHAQRLDRQVQAYAK